LELALFTTAGESILRVAFDIQDGTLVPVEDLEKKLNQSFSNVSLSRICAPNRYNFDP